MIYNIDKNIKLYEEENDSEFIRHIYKYLGRIIIHKKTGSDVNIYLGFENNIIYQNDAYSKSGINTFQYFRSATAGTFELINGNTDITFILLP